MTFFWARIVTQPCYDGVLPGLFLLKNFSTLGVIPLNIAGQYADEFFLELSQPISVIEELRLQMIKEALRLCIIGSSSFLRHRAGQLEASHKFDPDWPVIVDITV